MQAAVLLLANARTDKLSTAAIGNLFMNSNFYYSNCRNFVCAIGMCLALQGCVGTVVGAVVDTTIEVAKVPFKVVGAAVDLAIPDDDDEE